MRSLRLWVNGKVARGLTRVLHPYTCADAMFFLGLAADDQPATAELGYWVTRAHWHRGIATEAARAVLAHGFATLGLRSITSGSFEANRGSGRVLDKLGFVATGRLRRPCLATGHLMPSVWLCLRRPA